MRLELIRLEDIVEDDYNPRKKLKKGDAEYTKLENSLKAFGYVEPIVYNERTGHIVGGHQRAEILKAQGVEAAEMSVVDIDEKEEKLLNLRLNRIKGRWDYDKLEELLHGFTMDEALLTGFGSDELSVILAQAEPYDIPEVDDTDYYSDLGEVSGNDDFDGASWVVTLRFRDAEQAAEWCEAHGYEDAVKAGAKTTVIRAEG